jgi:carbonic anhydrase
MRKLLKAVLGLLLAAVCAEASAQLAMWPPPDGKTWDKLNQDYWTHTLKNSTDKATCETGQKQSPIPLPSVLMRDPTEPLPDQSFQFNYDFDPVNPWVFVKDTGHSWAVLLDPDQYRSVADLPNNLYVDRGAADMATRSPYPTAQDRGITRNGIFYKLVEAHFHFPAEHTLDGIRYPVEMHLVHQDANRNNKVVVAVFLSVTGTRSPNSYFDFLDKGAGQWVGAFSSVANMLPPLDIAGNRSYRRYSGSLTTPPCTEGIEWIVFTTSVEISTAVLNKLMARSTELPSNARPLNRVLMFQ